MKVLWSRVRDNPILQLELRRIRRWRWWPGRRFFLFYPILLGIALGFGVMLVATDWLSVQVIAAIVGIPIGFALGMIVWLLGLALPWIVPVLAAPAIARERELGTFDMLRTTLLSERAIVFGKLGACLAQLWPGILLLVLLSPFQLVGALGGGTLCLCPSYYDLGTLMLSAERGTEYVLGWLVAHALVGTLRPLTDTLLHAAIGVLVSTLVRSSGAAVAFTYGAVLAVRVAVWLIFSVLGTALLYVLLGSSVDFPVGSLDPFAPSWMLSNLMPLAIVGLEIVGGIVLIWGAVWRLERE